LRKQYFKYTLFTLITLLLKQANIVAAALSDPPVNNQTVFIQNKGQWDNAAQFMANIPGGQLYVEPQAWHFIFESKEDLALLHKHPRAFADDFKTYTVNGHSVRISFLGAGEDVTLNGAFPRKEYYNYFLGNDTSQWKSSVPLFERISISTLYNGIDAILYGGNAGGLKYDFVVQPGASPSKIRLQYTGQESIELKQGALQVKTSVNDWVEHKPYAYQLVNGTKRTVECAFVLQNNTVSFDIGTYDPTLPLVIDPLLIFSTYSGSSVDNFGHSATYDKDGHLYAAGIATSPTIFPNGRYPTTPGAFQQIWGGGVGQWPQAGFPCDIAISKYTADGSALLFATYLGGSRNDYPHSLVTDTSDNLIVFGTTLSANFPMRTGCYDITFNDSFDIIVSKLSADGTQLLASTYVGGNKADGINVADSLRMNYADEFRGEVIIDKFNDIIIASSTSSANFPVTASAFQLLKNGVQDGCIFKLNNQLTVLKSSTFFGQSKQDAVYSLDLDSSGNVYFTGGTQSTNFTVSPNTQKGSFAGGFSDGFVGRMNNSLSNLTHFRYWGSIGYDQSYFVKLDPTGNPVVFGQHFDSVPIINASYRTPTSSLFITKFKPLLDSIIFSTSIGDSIKNNALSPSAFLVDECGVIYGSVWSGTTNRYGNYITFHSSQVITTTNNMPITADAFQSSTDGSDFYLFALSRNSDSLLYGTYFGEIGDGDHVDGGTSRFDKKGIIYQSVCASCSKGTVGNFPTTVGSFSPSNASPRCSNASFKLDFRKSNIVYAQFDYAPKKLCLDSYIVVTFTNKSYNAVNHFWYVNGVLKSTNYHFVDTISQIGNYVVKLIEVDSSRCIIVDSSEARLNVGVGVQASFTTARDTCSPNVTFVNTTTPSNTPIKWYFGGGDTASATTITRTFPADGLYQILLIANGGQGCPDTALYNLNYDPYSHVVKASFFPHDSIGCEPAGFTYINSSNKYSDLKWYVNDSLVSTAFAVSITLWKGNYLIKLVSEDSTTCNKKDSAFLPVIVTPEVYPLYTDTQDQCSFAVSFYGQANPAIDPGDSVFYFWNFGNGVTSWQKDTTISYDTAGTYSVSLTLNKGTICEHTVTKPITIDVFSGVLNAFFVPDPVLSCTPGIVKFTNFSTNEQHLEWYYNDVLRTTTANYTDTFYTDTIIKVKLKVYSDLTCIPSDSFDSVIIVKNTTRSAFNFIKDSCSTDVLFINQSSSDNQEPLNYNWYFGDGDSSTLKNPTHIYESNGSYTVTLITNKGTQCADTSSLQIQYDSLVHELIADFELNDSVFCSPAALVATNQSVNGNVIQWLLNSIPVSNSKDFSQTIDTPGVYLLTLIVGNPTSCSKYDTLSKEITVSLSGEAKFKIERDSCSLTVQLVNQSSSPSGLPLTYLWYFGDGDSSVEKSPVHLFKKSDQYTLTLITNPYTPCADTATQAYFIAGDSASEVHVPNVFTPNGDGFNDCFVVSGVSKDCGTYRIKIYNRWGELYFSSIDPGQCWNGKNESGAKASEGVYFYIMEIQKPNQPKNELHGTLTLIRE
jgi:gliding motility-associated-like protein